VASIFDPIILIFFLFLIEKSLLGVFTSTFSKDKNLFLSKFKPSIFIKFFASLNFTSFTKILFLFFF